jgi:hypothetical protein
MLSRKRCHFSEMGFRLMAVRPTTKEANAITAKRASMMRKLRRIIRKKFLKP